MTVIRRLEDIPRFANEDEEHAFWASHELSDRLWDEAEALGPDELPPPRAERRLAITIRLDERTLQRVKTLARQLHESYQTLLEELVVAGLAEQ